MSDVDPAATPDGGGGRNVSRREARRQALQLLYEADVRGRPVPAVLSVHLSADEPPAEFAVELVRGVHRHRDEIDALIRTHAKGWTIERMPIVDRNLLRIGLFELLHVEAVPAAVAINEAVALAKDLSTEDSGRFINGILARVARDVAPPVPPP